MRPLRLAITIGYLLLVIATAAMPLLGWQRPYAPLSVLPRPAPVTLTIVYGTEKQRWLEDAAAAFEASGITANGASIDIELRGLGSRESMQGLLDGSLKPDVWSPASDLWLALLNQEWQQRAGRPLVPTSGSDAPQMLVLTPIVLAAWQQRAAALSDGGQSAWQNLHASIVAPEGWGAKGHPEWGTVKWGHATPTVSNNGLQALLLMAYDYHRKSSGLTVADVQDPEFLGWLSEMERAASFNDSSATLMNDMIAFGPSRYDAVATYENLALAQMANARSRWNDNLVLIYPPANLWSNHPYAILDAEWVTPTDREAARQFRDFLLSRAQQEQAVQLGFRPALRDVPLDGAASPFTRNASAGVRLDVPTLVEVPEAAVLDALLDAWKRAAQR
ncbi:MAG TPA: substrate-binding domain-containing protein [Herpetosiphonaceae bacterium]